MPEGREATREMGVKARLYNEAFLSTFLVSAATEQLAM